MHFFVYYTGEEFRDEGDLLYVAPMVYKRAEPYKPGETAAAGAAVGAAGAAGEGGEEGGGDGKVVGEGGEKESEWGKRVDERVGKLMAALAADGGGRFAGLAAEAAAQGEAEEKAKQKWLLESMSNEDEGRWRCAAQGCTKLFKSADFLQKHLLLKHVDGLEAALATVRFGVFGFAAGVSACW